MNTIKYIKSFSKGQITIPKEMREALGIGEDFWLKVYLAKGKIIAEPFEEKKDVALYRKKLLQIKGDWIAPNELSKTRVQIEERLAKEAL